MAYDSSNEEVVQQLKREGKFEDALTECKDWIARTEHRATRLGSTVESWPYWQACVILRKLKRPADEAAIIERFMQQPSSGSKQSREVMERLTKAYRQAGLTETRTVDGQSVDYYIPENVRLDERPMFVRDAVVIDCETTGLGATDEVIELALIRLRYSHLSGRILEVLDRYSGLREPSVPIPPAATQIHGLRLSDVAGHQFDLESARRAISGTTIAIAHNADFDRRMVVPILSELQDIPWFCTMRSIDWTAKGCPSRRLADVAAYNGIVAPAHRAMGDAEIVLDILTTTDKSTGQSYLHELIADVPLGYVSSWKSLRDADEDQDDDEGDDYVGEMVVRIELSPTPAPRPAASPPPVYPQPTSARAKVDLGTREQEPARPTESESIKVLYIAAIVSAAVFLIIAWAALTH
jgi:DNA polymerase III epsilon subunit-like protein